MLIMGIETSCDETSVAVIKGEIEDGMVKNALILSSCTFSQADIHAVFGGVVPEVASRNHMQKIMPLYNRALDKAGIAVDEIDLFAVTNAPGLIGALFVGVAFAKGLAYALKKPVIPINHLSGHILSAELTNQELNQPYAALVISGGHTHIYDVCHDDTKNLRFNLWGRTIDDAAGEAFDKVSIMLGGGYPGGPYVEQLAVKGNPLAVKFPVALKKTNNFSFSGLKTSVLTKIAKKDESIENIAASFQHTVALTLADKAITACRELGRNVLSISGGVACNSYLRKYIAEKSLKNGIRAYFPSKELCNDNAAMIAYAALKLTSSVNTDIYLKYDFKAGDTAHEIIYQKVMPE